MKLRNPLPFRLRRRRRRGRGGRQLQSELFTADVLGRLKPLLDAAPDVRIYQVT